MQFDVQAVKLPSPIGERSPSMLDCHEMRNGSTTAGATDILSSSNFNQRRTGVGVSPNIADNGELITPKKPSNPCLESTNYQDLHRELLFNNKIGKNVLNQKSELHKALEKYKDTQAKKEIMRQKLESKSVLEKAIEERAKKLEMQEKPATTPTDSEKLEFLQIHAKLCSKTENK